MGHDSLDVTMLVNTPSYLWRPEFDFWFRSWLSWLNFFFTSWVLADKCYKLNHNHFFQHSSQFIIHNHPTIWHYSTCITEKALLNELKNSDVKSEMNRGPEKVDNYHIFYSVYNLMCYLNKGTTINNPLHKITLLLHSQSRHYCLFQLHCSICFSWMYQISFFQFLF